jgi:hypothetical protein
VSHRTTSQKDTTIIHRSGTKGVHIPKATLRESSVLAVAVEVSCDGDQQSVTRGLGRPLLFRSFILSTSTAPCSSFLHDVAQNLVQIGMRMENCALVQLADKFNTANDFRDGSLFTVLTKIGLFSKMVAKLATGRRKDRGPQRSSQGRQGCGLRFAKRRLPGASADIHIRTHHWSGDAC